MAEADRFLVEALTQSECIPAGASAFELRDLSSSTFVSIIWRCLAKIQAAEPHLNLSIPDDTEVQEGVAARHRVGSQLASILKELGYAGDCGYNHFLYPNEKESRNILSWLVSKLPRSSTTEIPARATKKLDTMNSANYLSEERLASTFSAWMKKKSLYTLPNRDIPQLRGYEKLPLLTTRVHLPWSIDSANSDPHTPFLPASPQGASITLSVLEALSSAQRQEALRIDSLDDEDDQESSLIGSDFGGRIVENANEGVYDGVNPDNDESFNAAEGPGLHIPPFFVSAAGVLRENALAKLESQDNEYQDVVANAGSNPSGKSSKETEMLEEEARQATLEHIHARLLETQQHIEQLRDQLSRDQDVVLAVQRRVEESKLRGVQLRHELATKRQLLDLLPQAEDNMKKLQSVCDKNEAKLTELAQEWEKHKLPLAQEEQTLLSMKSNRKAWCRQFLAEMKVFRAEMQTMATAIQDKMESLRALDKVYSTLPQNINRHSYTNRIMDIIKQVHKQKQEISKIIEDIKSIQKQLNFSSEKLKRSEAVTDEKLFGEASKQVSGNSASARDPNNPYVECYRKFAQVRELFEELILVVGDVGKKENNARDLENWITQLQSRDSSAQLDRVLADLQSVRQENATLNDQLRALRTV